MLRAGLHPQEVEPEKLEVVADCLRRLDAAYAAGDDYSCEISAIRSLVDPGMEDDDLVSFASGYSAEDFALKLCVPAPTCVGRIAGDELSEIANIILDPSTEWWRRDWYCELIRLHYRIEDATSLLTDRDTGKCRSAESLARLVEGFGLRCDSP